MRKGCIFAKSEILSMLLEIDKKYKNAYLRNTPQNIRFMKAYSKMAVIIFCGWLEDGIHDLAKISILKLKDIRNQQRLERMLKSIHGFNYDSHFSKALIISFGAHGFEFIESEVGDADIARLQSTLGMLKIWRDDAAHSHAVVINCDPNRIILEMKKIFPILKMIEVSARKYRNTNYR